MKKEPKRTLFDSFTTSVIIISDEFCEEFPHNFIPTPGYWIECSRQKITTDTIWDESESDHDNEIQEANEETTDGTDQENGNGVRKHDRST